jgi:predicted Zn-dependent protease
VNFFEVLMEQGRGGSSPVSRFFSTHPLTQERIAYTQALVDELPTGQKLIHDDATFQDVRSRLR